MIFLDLVLNAKTRVASGAIAGDVLDALEHVIDRSRATPKGEGFGLTAQHPYVETAQYAASIMTFLDAVGRPSRLEEYRDGCSRYIRSFFRGQDGFCDTLGGPPYVFATYFAVTTLAMLDRLDDEVRAGCAVQLQLFFSRVFIAADTNRRPDIKNLFWAAVAARVAGSTAGTDTAAVERFLASCHHSDGGYGNTPGVPARLIPTAHAVLIKVALSLHVSPADRQRVVNYLLQRHTPHGRYVDRLAERPTPYATMLGAIAISALVDSDATTTTAGRLDVLDLWHAHTSLSAYWAWARSPRGQEL